VKRGVEVTLVELQTRILNLLLDVTASNIVTRMMEQAGVHIVTSQTVKEIVGTPENGSSVGGVVLTNDETLPCDLVIIAIGVVPHTQLVTGTAVETNIGILVDRFMQTTVEDVYSCGDVAEVYDFILDERRPLPLWPLAYLGGRVAGYNMAGKKTEYLGGTAMSALKYFDVPIISVGLANPDENDGYEELVTHDPLKNHYKKIVFKDDLIVGMTFVGDIERTGIIFYLMKNRVKVGGFKKGLISDDFGLVTLPEPLRNRMLLSLFLGI
jgi:NAD(P)H-nitrite reductase large subunit